jgi:hypothetical protein
MRALAILLVACGGSSQATVDAAAEIDAPPAVATCDGPTPFTATPSRTLRVGTGETYATIEAAAAAATPGTRILLAGGTHASDQFIEGLRGTAEAPIWIGGEAGARIVGGGEAIHLSRPQYVMIHDLEISGQTANGINIDDGGDEADPLAAHHVMIVRVDIHDVGMTGNQDCIKVSGVNDLAVLDSRLARCGGGDAGSGIDHVGCHRSVIARNTFDAMSGNSVQAKGGSTDIDIRQNRVRDGGARVFNLGGSTGLEFFRPPLTAGAPNAEARRIRAFDNFIFGATDAPFAFVGCVDCLVAHNTVITSSRWLLRILQETPTQGGFTFEPARRGRVINNSFVFLAAQLATAVNVGAGTEPATFTFSNNLWHASDNASQSTPTLPVAETGSVIGMGSIYVGAQGDPALPLAPPACASGPEPGRGAPLDEIAGTFEGTCRSGTPTIGAQHCP